MRYHFGEWELDSDLYELRHAGQVVRIEPKVFNVLAYLVQHHNRVISKHELLERLWPGQHIGVSALERCITSARKVLGDNGEDQHTIRTLHGRGYRFLGHVEQDEPQVNPPPARRTMALAPHATPTSVLQLVTPAAPNQPVIPHGTRKLVTALSGKLGNALVLAEELGTEAMHNLMERFFLLSLRKIEENDGRLSHLLDAGFLALFGLSQTDADAALPAVRVAVELHNHWNDDLKTRHLTDPAAQLRMGLHTGMVIKREIGAEQHRVYMPVGDTIYLANALQHYAEPGTILSSEATYRRVQDVVYGSVAGLMPIEGKTSSAVTYNIFGLNEIALHPPHILSSLS